ncbi:MAG TPA: hypothetical protein EYN66_13485 [Myxococcales bacterium]|nr:hypothetical protein [Myxococcales bacterium]
MILLVGENGNRQPSTAQDAKSYKASHDYPAGVISVSDPKWMKVSQAVTHGNTGTIGLPYFILFGEDMTIVSSGQGENLGADLNNIFGKPFVAPQIKGSCAGTCGQKTSGCYCDNKCSQYGDCCPDICEACNIACP